MKRLKFLLALIVLLPITGKAAVYHCSAPSSVESGETISVTVSGSLSSASTTWTGLIVGEGNASYSSGDLNIWADGASFSRTVYFTAGNPGTATFYVGNIDVSDENQEYSGSDTCTVNITSASRPNGAAANIYDITNDDDDEREIDPDKASNSYLKSLSVEGFKLSPAFNKDKMEYTIVVPGDKEKVTIKGELEDDKASVEGLGEVELKEGINKIEVRVTAENGEVRKYIISITRKEKNPIEVTINKKKYTVAKKDIGLKVPDGFTKTTVVIDKQEVVAYSNEFTGYLIVALVDEDGNAGWFIYNQKNSTYSKYSELKSSGVRLIILEPNKKDIPYKYKKCKIDIDGLVVDGYYLELGSTYRIVYALNMDTGEKSFYLYDMQEKTFQRFYNRQVNIYRELLKKLEIGIIALVGIIIIMFIVIISQRVIHNKTKKIIKNGGKIKEDPIPVDEDDIEERNELLKEKIKEKSNAIEDAKKKNLSKTRNIDLKNEEEKEEKKEEKNLTKEEIKRKNREEKEELARMRRDFFDL